MPPKNLWNQKELASIADRPVDGKVYNGDIPVYQALTQAMDTELGRLLAYLDSIGERDNTLIIFMGDNGTPQQVQRKNIGALRGAKWDILDGGVRVPLVVAGAGVSRHGVRENALVVATDMFSTVAQMAGADTIGHDRQLLHCALPQARWRKQWPQVRLHRNVSAVPAAGKRGHVHRHQPRQPQALLQQGQLGILRPQGRSRRAAQSLCGGETQRAAGGHEVREWMPSRRDRTTSRAASTSRGSPRRGWLARAKAGWPRASSHCHDTAVCERRYAGKIATSRRYTHRA